MAPAGRKCTLAAALLLSCAVANPAEAQTSEQVKPYILLVLDTSGSMTDNATGQGAPSCGGLDTRFNHAKCAIQNLVDTHGDIVFGLSQFRSIKAAENDEDTDCEESGLDCNNGVYCGDCSGNNCEACKSSAERFELLVPLVDDNAGDVLSWVDFSAGTCTFDPAMDPEIPTPASNWFTPIAGALKGAKRYWQGSDPHYEDDLEPIYGSLPGDPIPGPQRDRHPPGRGLRQPVRPLQ